MVEPSKRKRFILRLAHVLLLSIACLFLAFGAPILTVLGFNISAWPSP